MAIYFISDLHLDIDTPALTQALGVFLETTAKGAEALYILGDLYDAWIGDDDDSAIAKETRDMLKAYVDSGTPTFLLHGNRDFLVGERFCDETGVQLIPDMHLLDLYGHETLLMHGDTLCTLDHDYQQFRQTVRNDQWKDQVLSMALTQRRMMAKTMRTQSTSHNAIKLDEIMDVTPDEVVKVMISHSVDRIIHGHTHRPAKHQLEVEGKPAERIVLGDWGKTGWYIKAEPESLELKEFAIEACEPA